VGLSRISHRFLRVRGCLPLASPRIRSLFLQNKALSLTNNTVRSDPLGSAPSQISRPRRQPSRCQLPRAPFVHLDCIILIRLYCPLQQVPRSGRAVSYSQSCVVTGCCRGYRNSTAQHRTATLRRTDRRNGQDCQRGQIPSSEPCLSS
jgi:hypothetical protein